MMSGDGLRIFGSIFGQKIWGRLLLHILVNESTRREREIQRNTKQRLKVTNILYKKTMNT